MNSPISLELEMWESGASKYRKAITNIRARFSLTKLYSDSFLEEMFLVAEEVLSEDRESL